MGKTTGSASSGTASASSGTATSSSGTTSCSSSTSQAGFVLLSSQPGGKKIWPNWKLPTKETRFSAGNRGCWMRLDLHFSILVGDVYSLQVNVYKSKTQEIKVFFFFFWLLNWLLSVFYFLWLTFL